MLPTKRVSGKVVALALAVFAASCCFSFAASEYEYAVLDDVPSPAPPRAAQNIPPPRLLSSTTDPNTGLRVDTYVKPLGVLRPGEVLNTDPTSDVGRLLRPKMNSTDEPMLVVRLTFDLVNGDTLEPLPLDRLYNHHLVIYSRPDMDGGLHQMNLSAVLAPCGVGAYFAGGGAEWRGKRQRQDDLLKIDPTGDGGFFHGEDLWVDPPLANWGLNIHAIDLRDVGNTRNAVQCSCAYYGKTNPGTPQQFDQSPRRGGGIECCGAEARGPVLNDSNEPVPIALTYEVRWAPLSEALATLKSSEQFVKTLNQLQRGAPKGATLMMSSSPDLDGASCAGEYNARPCPGAYEYDESIAGLADAGANVAPLEKITAEAKAWAARDNDSASGAKSPRNQKCLDVESPKPGYPRSVRPITVTVDQAIVQYIAQYSTPTLADSRLTVFFPNESIATSHVFRLPNNTAYAVSRITGHQHVGGYGVKLLNVTGIDGLDPEGDASNSSTPPYKDAPVVCESVPRYGTGAPGTVGDEEGFIVKMPECVFDVPLMFLPGQAYVVQSTYGADAANFAPAKFPPPYEGVMGYIILGFTIPKGFEPGVFSQSGERVLGGDPRDEKKDDGFGTCVASTQSSLKTAEDSLVISDADSPAQAPEPDSMGIDLVKDDGLELPVSQKKTVTLTPPNANPELTMAWRFGTNNTVQIELTLVDTRDTSVGKQLQPEIGPTWLSLGVHRLGGRGMPGADMVVVQSADGGQTWVFDEHYTDAYDAPKPRSFYGESVSVVKSSQCGVAFKIEKKANQRNELMQVVSFERLVEVPFAESGLTVANVTKGQPTPVIWAFGDFGQTRMAYHGRKAGNTVVTW